MVLDIIAALEFETALPNGKFLLATKDNRSDLGFVFSEILSFLLKKNYGLIMVNMAQSFSHYNHLLIKSGANIKSLRDHRKISVIDILGDFEKIISSTSTEISDEHVLGISTWNSDACQSLKKLYEQVVDSVNVVCTVASKPEGYVLFVDEINVLLNLGLELKAIQPFVQYCYSLVVSAKDVPGFLLIGGIYDNEDEESLTLMNYLAHLADMRIQVEGLMTGYSKDIHGKIFMEVKDKKECKSKSQKVLFKVEDKGAKLLPLGL